MFTAIVTYLTLSETYRCSGRNSVAKGEAKHQRGADVFVRPAGEDGVQPPIAGNEYRGPSPADHFAKK